MKSSKEQLGRWTLLHRIAFVIAAGAFSSVSASTEATEARDISVYQLRKSNKLMQHHVAYCEKHKFLMCSAAKAASKDVLLWMSRACDPDLKPDPPIERPYSDQRTPNFRLAGRKIPMEERVEWFQNWVVVEVGRDPWRRAIDGYYDDFFNITLDTSNLACEVAKKVRGPWIGCTSFDNPISFEEYVEYITSTKDTEGGASFEHFASQGSACPEWLRPDRTFHYERLSSDLKILSLDMELDQSEIVKIPDPEAAMITEERVREHYGLNCTNVRLVHERFRDDIEHFRYPPPACREPRNITVDHIKQTRLIKKHTAYCDKMKFLVCSAAQAASSEVLRWTSRVCTDPDPPILRAHADPRSPLLKNALSKYSGDEILKWFKTWTIIEVGRNPWTRAVAGYYEVFHDKLLSENEWSCTVARMYRGNELKCSDHDKPLQFQEFIEYITSQPDDRRGRFEHFSTQISACPEWLEPDYSIRYESLYKDLVKISKDLELDQTLAHRHSPEKEEAVAALVVKYLGGNCTNVERIHQRYLADVEYFGYKPPKCQDTTS